jgi:hypothetical protein
MLLQGFELRGLLHLKSSSMASCLLAKEFERFIPVTRVSLAYQGSPVDIGGADVAFVCRGAVDLMHIEREATPTDLSSMLQQIIAT